MTKRFLCRKIVAVLYKSYLYRKGQLILLVFELSLPAIFTGGLLGLSTVFGKDVLYTLPLFVTLGLFLSIVLSVGGIVSERETGFKELLKIMGLDNWIQWLGWLANSWSVSIPSMTIMGLMTAFGFLHGCDKSVIVFLFICFPIQSIAFAYFLSSFFSKHTQALGIIGMLWFVLYIAQLFIINNFWEPLTLQEKMPACLIPHLAFGHTIYILADLTFSSAKANDRDSHQVTWVNLFQPHTLLQPTIELEKPPRPLTLGLTMVMMLSSSVVYILLAMYVDNILPREFGVRKPFYYPFLINTWCTIKPKRVKNGKGSKNNDLTFDTKSMDDSVELDFGPTNTLPMDDLVTLMGDPWDRQPLSREALNFEPEPIDGIVGVELLNVKKIYGKEKIALNGLTLKIFQGEITALLGRNGTGKTTLMRILTGMTAATSGRSIVNGHNVETNVDAARQDLGYCPQDNMLFDRLTVENHLEFAGRLKGQTGKELSRATKFLLDQLNLTEKRKVVIKNLSGGQKRKVQLGMALMGQAKVIFLDEPTSGMDPESHRLIWNLLLHVRTGKTIILTSQSMEEAEVLGDRIVILSQGKIKCSGSALYLKKIYGSGYTLHVTIDTESEIESSAILPERWQSASSVEKTFFGTWPVFSTCASKSLKLVQKHIEQVSLVPNLGPNVNNNEIKIRLPILENSNVTSKFPALFTDLYEKMESLHIKHIGLTYTTISDVFAKVAELEDREKQVIVKPSVKDGGPEPLKFDLEFRQIKNEVRHLTGFALSRRQFHGLWVKRCRCGVRKWKILVIQIVLAVGLTIGALFMFNDLYANQIYRDIPEFFAAIIFLGVSFLSSSFILIPLDEKLSKAKQLQLMTGVNVCSYWLSFFLWDFFIVLITVTMMTICIPCIDKYDILVKSSGPAIFILILVVYEISAISFSYVFSLAAKTIAGGFTAALSFHLVFGLVLGFLFSILEREEDIRPHVTEASSFLNIFPPFAGLKSLAKFTSVLTRNGQGCLLNEEQLVVCDTTSEFEDASELETSLREMLPCCQSLRSSSQ